MDTRVQIPQSRGNRALESMQVARRVADSTSGEPRRVPITSTAQSAVFLSVDASHGLPITEISASRTSPLAASKTPQRNATAAAATSKAPLPAISSPPPAQQQSVSKQQSPDQTPSRVPSLSTPSRFPSLSPSSLHTRPASSSQFLRPQDRQLVSIVAETTGSSQERYSRQLSLKRQPSTGTPDTGTETRSSTTAQQSKSSVTSGSAAVSTLASSPAIRGRVDVPRLAWNRGPLAVVFVRWRCCFCKPCWGHPRHKVHTQHVEVSVCMPPRTTLPNHHKLPPHCHGNMERHYYRVYVIPFLGEHDASIGRCRKRP